MRESVIRDYLAGRVGVAMLRLEIEREQAGIGETEEAPSVGFELLRRHLLSLCDAVLEGELPAAGLPMLAACMARSPGFVRPGPHPEARVVGEVLARWERADPAAIGHAELVYYRKWLLAGREPVPARDLA